MFQENPNLCKTFWRVGAFGVFTGSILTFFTQGSFLTKYALIGITGITIFVLSLWLPLMDDLKPSSKTKIMTVTASFVLFLSINCNCTGVTQ